MRFHDLEDQIKKLKEELENLTDANDIIDEAFGEDGALKLGEPEAGDGELDDGADVGDERLLGLEMGVMLAVVVEAEIKFWSSKCKIRKNVNYIISDKKTLKSFGIADTLLKVS